MPIYDYVCPKCDNVDEKTHSWKEEPEVTCSKCGEKHKRRLVLHPPRIVARSPWQGG